LVEQGCSSVAPLFDIRNDVIRFAFDKSNIVRQARFLLMATTHPEADDKQAEKPKFIVNIEGTEHPWAENTISVTEIRALGNIPADQQIIEVNLDDGTERTLAEDERVQLKRGHGFAKKVRFQRG
jgi:hypothetical protein